MKYEYNCFFCKNPLTRTDKVHSQSRYIYICNHCQGPTEHLFYNEEKSLTLRTFIQVNSTNYTLYMYLPSFGYKPLEYPVRLVREKDNKVIIELPTLDGFFPHNLQAKVERLLSLKAFY